MSNAIRLVVVLAVWVAPRAGWAQYGGEQPAVERVVSSNVGGERSGHPSLTALLERDDEGRGTVVVSCNEAVAQTRRERVETVTEGDYWPVYAGIAVVGLIGGTASAVATAALSGGAGDPGERQLTTALGITGALAGAAMAVGGGVVAFMRMPQTTTSERTVPNGLMDAHCLPGVAIEIQAPQWSDAGETDDDGIVRFVLPSSIESASVTFASSDVGTERVTVGTPPTARHTKSEAELHAEAVADVAAEARHDAELAERAAEQAEFDRRYEAEAAQARAEKAATVAVAWAAQRDRSLLAVTTFIAENGEEKLPDDARAVWATLSSQLEEGESHVAVRVGKTRWWLAKAPASAFDEFIRCGLLASRRAAAVDWAQHACRPMKATPRAGVTTESAAVKLDDETWIVLTESPQFFDRLCAANGDAAQGLKAVAEQKAREMPASKLPVSPAWFDAAKLDASVWKVTPMACSLGRK